LHHQLIQSPKQNEVKIEFFSRYIELFRWSFLPSGKSRAAAIYRANASRLREDFQQFAFENSLFHVRT
jgi:hypothetical protein